MAVCTCACAPCTHAHAHPSVPTPSPPRHKQSNSLSNIKHSAMPTWPRKRALAVVAGYHTHLTGTHRHIPPCFTSCPARMLAQPHSAHAHEHLHSQYYADLAKKEGHRGGGMHTSSLTHRRIPPCFPSSSSACTLAQPLNHTVHTYMNICSTTPTWPGKRPRRRRSGRLLSVPNSRSWRIC